MKEKAKVVLQPVEGEPDDEFFEKMAQIKGDTAVQEDDNPKDLGEAYGMIAQIMANPLNIKILTEVSEEEIRKFAAVEAVADYIKMPELKALVNNIMTLKISKSRLGRKELLELAQNMSSSNSDQQSRLRKIMSLGGRF